MKVVASVFSLLSRGTANAETCIAYCRVGEEQEDDTPFKYEGFTAWFEEKVRRILSMRPWIFRKTAWAVS
ncbi:MAG: hypothetical protein CM1200mP9_02500 [Gammaproteobacteria bacterium]|nr:MAG: hypothetical protein CM1200mP9_02500 [Gammaproteobacteria bacterium]